LSTNTVYPIFGRVAQAANHVMQYVEIVCKLKKDRNCSYSLQPNNFNVLTVYNQITSNLCTY